MTGQLAHPQYRADIDGLRAIAVLSVVAFHAAPGRMPGGFIGVDIFFVISGFLISSIILKGLETGSFSFVEFYRRRIKRIFPALIVVLLCMFCAGYFVLVDDEMRQLSKHIAAGAGFVSNFVLWSESGYFDLSADMKPLLHLWSLGIEEQFYIFWPLMLWAAWKWKLRSTLLIAVLGILSFALSVHESGSDAVAAFYSPLTRFWELLVGAGLASLSLPQEPAQRPTASALATALGAGMLLAGFTFIDKARPFPGWWAILPTVGTALIIWAGPGAWLNRTLLSNRVLVWFGLISFPLYLWHWPALSFLRILEGTEVDQWKRLVAMVVAILLAWLTYKLVERPVRRQQGSSVAWALLAIMGVLGVVGLYGYLDRGFEGRVGGPKIVNAGDIGHDLFFQNIATHYFPCTPKDISETAGDWNGFVRCFQSKQGHPDVVLLGDSHAEHLFPGLASRLVHSNVVFYGKGGLPVRDNKEFSRIFDVILPDSRIGTVLVGAEWAEKIKESGGDWQKSLDGTVKSLTAAGKQVYLVDDVPQFPFLPSRCKFSGRLGVSTLCVARDVQDDASYIPFFEKLAAENANVHVIRIRHLFCNGGFCAMGRNGALYYRDDNHLNVTGSDLVARDIAARLGQP